MESLLRDKYASIPIDLVIAIGPQALDFLSQRRASLFPGIPMIFAGVSEASMKKRSVPPNSTGVVSAFRSGADAGDGAALQPDARQVVVVTGASAFDQIWESRGPRETPSLRRPPPDDLSVGPAAAAVVGGAGSPAAARDRHLSQHFRGWDGQAVRSARPRGKDFCGCQAPVYSVSRDLPWPGHRRRLYRQLRGHRQEAARLGLRVLTGEPAASLPPEDVQTQAFMVDARQLRRWGLDEARLPPGTIVRFEQPSLWQRYRGSDPGGRRGGGAAVGADCRSLAAGAPAAARRGFRSGRARSATATWSILNPS